MLLSTGWPAPHRWWRGRREPRSPAWRASALRGERALGAMYISQAAALASSAQHTSHCPLALPAKCRNPACRPPHQYSPGHFLEPASLAAEPRGSEALTHLCQGDPVHGRVANLRQRLGGLAVAAAEGWWGGRQRGGGVAGGQRPVGVRRSTTNKRRQNEQLR